MTNSDDRTQKVLEELKSLQRDLSKTVKALNQLSRKTGPRRISLKGEIKEIEKLKKALPKPEHIANQIESAWSWVDAKWRELQNEREDATRRFSGELHDRLADELGKMKKWGDGLAVGLFLLKVRPEALNVDIYYGPKQFKLCVEEMEAEVVAKRLRSLRQNLGATLPASQFAEVLRCAHSRARSKAGEKIPLYDLLPQIAIQIQPAAFYSAPEPRNFRAYMPYDLSFDLYTLRDSGKPSDLRIVTATRANTSNKTGSLWVPNSEDVDNGEHLADLQYVEGVK